MKTAVVLFNLGGPDSLKAVKPFLFNLFSDPAIIRLPGLFRFLLASWLSRKREHEASEIYQHIGGCSPIFPNTQKQVDALQNVLGENFKVFVVMRYWHPRAEEVFHKVKSYDPVQVVLLPLYPQFSSTTTASSFKEWQDMCQQKQWSKPTRKICCYPTQPQFIEATTKLLKDKLSLFSSLEKVRVLFSAHGLPQRIVNQGDPYQWQIERSVSEILRHLGKPILDYVVCYQSRVGPLKWLEPYTDVEITRAGNDGISLVVVPISFVSEHSETLYELDIQYKKLATEAGVPRYERVSTLGIESAFISGLADLIKNNKLPIDFTPRICPTQFCLCINPGFKDD
jgi:ferrochelatase